MDFDKLRVVVIVTFAVCVLQASSNDVKTLYTNGYSYSQYFNLEENMAAEKTLRFSVRAPNDAHILLAPSYKANQPVYEIVLGAYDDTFTYIRGKCPCQEEPTAIIRKFNILSQKELRNFWIRLKPKGQRTFIQVGIGGEDKPFLEWGDSKPLNPKYLSFQSGTAAEWRYGYSDETYTKGVSTDKRKSVVTSTGYGQYFPLSEVVSHSDDAVTLYFNIWMSKHFQILLSPEVSYFGDVYEFELHEKGAYLRRQHYGENVSMVAEAGFLNKRERFEFWIKLTLDGKIMLGKRDFPNPILEWQDPYPVSPQFVSFSLYRRKGDDYDSHAISKLQYGMGMNYKLASQNCSPRWKEFSTFLPPGAVRGGYNNQDELFVCRVDHEGRRIPGSFIPAKNHSGYCQVTSGLFVLYHKPKFQVLTGCRFSWIPASLGFIPDGAIPAGETKEQTSELNVYISRVSYDGEVVIGQIQQEDELIYIGFKNRRLPFTDYEVLVNGLAGGRVKRLFARNHTAINKI